MGRLCIVTGSNWCGVGVFHFTIRVTKYRLRDATFNETFINNYKVKASWIFPFDLNISKQDTKGSILYLFINQNVPYIL